MNTDIKGILFDKDGTLIDFLATWMPALHEVADVLSEGNTELAHKMLAATGYDFATHTIKSGSILAAASNREIAEHWQVFLPHLDVQTVTETLESVFNRHAQNSKAVTDLVSLFATLKQQYGLKLGVATSDSQQGAYNTLQSLGVDQVMDFICGYDTGFGRKPEAGMVNGFCQKTGLVPAQVMVVGDNLHDIDMARCAQAGFAVGVLTGTSDREQLSSADEVLESIADLPELLNRLESAA